MVLLKFVMIKFLSLTFSATFGPLYSIGSALVTSLPFEVVSLVKADLTKMYL